jgi:hypothetical protein
MAQTKAELKAARFKSTFSIGEEGARFAGSSTSQDSFKRAAGGRPAPFLPPVSSVGHGDTRLVTDLPKNAVDPGLKRAYEDTRTDARRRRPAPKSDGDWGTGAKYDASSCTTMYGASFAGSRRSETLQQSQPEPPRPLRSQYRGPVNPISGEPRTLPVPPFEHPNAAMPRATLNVSRRVPEHVPKHLR